MTGKAKRVAVALDLQYGHKRHVETYAGCLKYAKEAGWDTVITPTSDRIFQPKEDEEPFDGVLARTTVAMANAAIREGVPVVNVWLNSPANNVPRVIGDFEESGRIAAKHLMSRGFRRFGYLGFLRDLDSRHQGVGFKHSLESNNYSCSVHRFARTSVEKNNAVGWDAFRTGLQEWVKSWIPPIGIFVCNDLYCRYLIDACQSVGLHVPQDVAIIGTANEPSICNSPYPALTSIDMDFEGIGYQAAELLDRLMHGEHPPERPKFIKPKKLVPRQSTDSFATEDSIVSSALKFIAENSNRPLSVQEVATAVGVNRRSLERRFMEFSNEGIAKQITRMRIERAKRLMIETKDTLKSIALDCGFRNSDHLSKSFLRTEKIKPSEFRRNHKRST